MGKMQVARMYYVSSDPPHPPSPFNCITQPKVAARDQNGFFHDDVLKYFHLRASSRYF